MIALPKAQQLTVSSVPLRPDCLHQASLFDERAYPLPAVLPGEKAVVYDADSWQDNFKRGTVIHYSYFTGLHTIRFDSITVERRFYGREIIKAFAT